MQKFTLTLLLLCLVGGATGAQIFMEPFNYAPGTTIGLWNEYRGDWNAVTNSSPEPVAESEQKTAYQYLVHPKFNFQDCAADCLVLYNTSSSKRLQFGGVTLRCNDPANDTDLIHIKIQDNNSSGDFDRVFVYDRPGSSVWADPTPTLRATVRLLAIDARLVGQVDVDGDGLWDLELTKTSALTVKAGPVGLCAYGGAQMDDFNLYDGVMLNDTASPRPQPGATLTFVMRGFPNAQYVAASSLGKVGIPLPDGRVVPLGPDGMFFASAQNLLPTLFRKYQGSMDGNGDASCSIALPKNPALVGVTVFTAFVNTGGGYILNISNDHQVTIIP